MPVQRGDATHIAEPLWPGRVYPDGGGFAAFPAFQTGADREMMFTEQAAPHR